MKYIWQIVRLGLQDELNQEGALLENSIVRVKWKKIAEDTDGVRASYVGETKLSAANVAQSDFIAVNEVAQADVVKWVQDSINTKEMARIDKLLSDKIERNRVREIKPNW